MAQWRGNSERMSSCVQSKRKERGKITHWHANYMGNVLEKHNATNLPGHREQRKQQHSYPRGSTGIVCFNQFQWTSWWSANPNTFVIASWVISGTGSSCHPAGTLWDTDIKNSWLGGENIQITTLRDVHLRGIFLPERGVAETQTQNPLYPSEKVVEVFQSNRK